MNMFHAIRQAFPILAARASGGLGAIAASLAIGACLATGHVLAQDAWPSRPIRLIAPFAAGADDAKARLLAIKLGARLGQPVIVENKGGAGGAIGIDTVAKAQPDGYTILFAGTGYATNPATGVKLPYDPAKDLVPIGQIGTAPLIFVGPNDGKVKSLRELLDMARSEPGRMVYGSGGVGSMSHLGVELLAARSNTKMLHVPYKGVTLALADMTGGSLQLVLTTVASSAPLVKAGRLRALAVTSPERSPFVEGIPAASEAGLPGFHIDYWWGLMGPAGMPSAVVKRLNDELNWALAQPDFREMLGREAGVPKPDTPENFGKLITSDLDRWTRLIKDANIKIE